MTPLFKMSNSAIFERASQRIEARILKFKRFFNKTLFHSRIAKSLILAAVSVITAVTGSILVSKLVGAQNALYLQKNVDNTASLLGNNFQNKIEQDIAYLLEIGENQLYPKIALQTSPKNSDPDSDGLHSGRPPSSGSILSIDALVLPRGILDISLWEQSDTQGVFNPDLSIRRVYSIFNSGESQVPPDLQEQAYFANETEKPLIQPAFHNHVVAILTQSTFGRINSLMLATTMGPRLGGKVIVAHFSLESFQNFFYKDGLVISSLVDDFGNIIAATDFADIHNPGANKKKLNETPLFQFMRTAASSAGHTNFFDQNGIRHFGGYVRLTQGQLALLSEISEAEATPVFALLKSQVICFIFVCFILSFSLGYWILFADGIGINGLHSGPQRILVTSLFGSLKNYMELVNTENPAQVTKTLNRFYQIVRESVEVYGGVYEKYPDLSFSAVWGVTAGTAPHAIADDGTEIWRALRCSLHLREQIAKWNELRRLDGLVETITTIGIHSGYGLWTQLSEESRPVLLGDVLNSAKTIQSLSIKHGVDLLISKDTWNQSEGKFLGDSITQAKISDEIAAQPVELFSLGGYRDEQGQAVVSAIPNLQTAETLPILLSEDTSVVNTSLLTKTIETPAAAKPSRWLVNNGSQILGPLDPAEIALRLFSQELDFDSECWAEGTGDSAQIKNAGIFSGSDSVDATLWVFDGKTVHGPVTLGFIKTALGHQAISQENYICEKSTTQGWKKLSTFYNERKAAAMVDGSDKPESEKALEKEEALRASLTPPAKK